LNLKPLILDNIAAGGGKISYPTAFDPKTFDTYLTGHFLGGVDFLPGRFYLKSAKSVNLHYFLVSDGPFDQNLR